MVSLVCYYRVTIQLTVYNDCIILELVLYSIAHLLALIPNYPPSIYEIVTRKP